MSEIPEEIRKMFPDLPIHKLDIVDGELQILASSEPLHETAFEGMTRDEFDDLLVELSGVHNSWNTRFKLLTAYDQLCDRAKRLESSLVALREQTRWIRGGDGSHWDGCEETHWDCKIAKMEKELRDMCQFFEGITSALDTEPVCQYCGAKRGAMGMIAHAPECKFFQAEKYFKKYLVSYGGRPIDLPHEGE